MFIMKHQINSISSVVKIIINCQPPNAMNITYN